MLSAARMLVLSAALSLPLRAQHAAPVPLRVAPPQAREYAFLIGQYELEIKPKMPGIIARIHGIPKLVGSWKGWRALDGFGVEDELRITDESGNPKLLSHAVRYFDEATRKWITSSVDVYRGVFAISHAEWKNNAMTSLTANTDESGKAYVVRGRYSEITVTSFKYVQDRSYDGGRTWDEPNLVITARKVAAVAPR